MLFGGYIDSGFDDQTWVWDGTQWNLRAVDGPIPAPRSAHALAYDSARGVTVLFGGYNFSGFNGETWEWDGVAWTQRAIGESGPSPRFGHAMVYDAARGVTVLVGGQVGGFEWSAETWEWDGVAWTQRADLGAAGRAWHSMAYDAARGVSVLFGGSYREGPGGVYTVSGETWEWDGVAWTRCAASGVGAPAGRAFAGMAYDASRGVSVLFGGDTGINAYSGELWERNGAGWTQRVANGPAPRSYPSIVYDAARGAAVVFGGDTAPGVSSTETWQWTAPRTAVWTQRLASTPTTTPTPRSYPSMAYDTARRVCVLFGGDTAAGVYSPETWEYDGVAWTMKAASGPSPRNAPAMAYDAARGVTILFGGYDASGWNGETWQWDGTAWTQIMVSGPAARSAHAIAYDQARGAIVLFGGYNGDIFAWFGDTWQWDGSAWTQLAPASSPSGRYGHAMAYDQARGVAVLFGGTSLNIGWNADTWEWDGTAWTQRAAGGGSGPNGRSWHAMAFDPSRSETLLFGGSYRDWRGRYIISGETWGWDGAAWTLHEGAGCTPRVFPAMVHDAARGVEVLFGGDTDINAYNGETWELGFIGLSQQPASLLLCPGGSTSLSVTAVPEADGPFTYQWRHGVPRADIPGATDAIHTILAAGEADAGVYDCVVTNAYGRVTSDAVTVTLCPVDFNCDGFLDFFDTDAFVTCFEGFECPPGKTADFNADGFLDFFDMDAFVHAFEIGC